MSCGQGATYLEVVRAVSWFDRTGRDAGDGIFGTGTNRREPEGEQPRRSPERVRVRMRLPLLDPPGRVARRAEEQLPGSLYRAGVVAIGWLAVSGRPSAGAGRAG